MSLAARSRRHCASDCDAVAAESKRSGDAQAYGPAAKGLLMCGRFNVKANWAEIVADILSDARRHAPGRIALQPFRSCTWRDGVL